MTTRTTPSPIQIIVDAGLRTAAEAGAAVVALDEGLSAVLFADAAGREIVGASETSPALRQIRSAARGLSQTGRARVLLRRSTRAGSKMVEAELVLRPAEGARPAFALMTLSGLGRPADDAAILGWADLTDRKAAVFADGALSQATASFASKDLPGLANRLAAFAAGAQSMATFDEGPVELTLARAPFGRIIALVEERDGALAEAEAMFETPAPEEPSTPPIPADVSPGVGSFSVRRPKLGGPRPGMSMGALLQRWHSRGPETAQAAEPDPAAIAPAPVGEIAPSQPRDEEAGTAAEIAAPRDTPPMRGQRLRSHWGTEGGTPASPVAPEAALPDMSAATQAPEGSAAEEATLPAGDAPAPAVDAAPPAHDPIASDIPNADCTGQVMADEAMPSSRAGSLDEPSLVSTSEVDAAPQEPVAEAAAEIEADAEQEEVRAQPAEAAASLSPVAATASATFVPRFDVAPVRFVWQIDREGAFRFLSPDFAGAVGPHAADVVGRSFAAVARVFGFDETREIARLLERRDTWSGRTIFWPVQGSDRKAPVDLAALPVYGRDRSFDGFRGFGIVRLNESVPDDESLGLYLTQGTAPVPGDEPAADVEDEADRPAPETRREKPLLRRFEAESFGRRAEPPAAIEPAHETAPETASDPTQKVIRLEERRRPREGVLSTAEEAAFRAIGAKLGQKAEAESPGALRFEEPATPASSVEDPDPEAPELAADPVAETATAVMDVPRSAQAPGQSAEIIETPEGAIGDERRPATAGIESVDAVAASGEDPSGTVEDAAPTVVASIETASPANEEPAESWDDDEVEPPLDIAVFERLFAGLPLAVLVQVQERTVYTNAEFAALTGHADADAVEAAGGLDVLVLDRQGEGTLALQRADGEIVEVHAHMQRTAEGGRSALLMSFQRVADEETVAGPALEDLRQEVEELQAVLDTATDGVVLLDINGHIRAMNGSAHALFGIGADEAFGRHLTSLFAHESQKAAVDYLDMLRDDGIGGILNDGREVIGRVSQGGFIPLFITIGRLSGERGWCVVIRDIAHWKRIEEDLVNARRQAEAASLHKSRFLANISHELRTPLNAIIGFADVMSSECFGPIGNERYLEYLGDIKRSGHHVLDLVNDLLDISKIEAGKVDLTFEAVSLNEVVSEAVSLMQPQANRERVIVRSNLPSSVPPVVADRRSVRQIALNLLANAIRFTPAGGQIIASTTYSAEGDVLLRFRDSGIGMTEREIELALTPFQQVHAPSANRGEGTGLGLPLTKAMVEANRAYFSIQSTPGEGTLVEIIFPAPRVLAD